MAAGAKSLIALAVMAGALAPTSAQAADVAPPAAMAAEWAMDTLQGPDNTHTAPWTADAVAGNALMSPSTSFPWPAPAIDPTQKYVLPGGLPIVNPTTAGSASLHFPGWMVLSDPVNKWVDPTAGALVAKHSEAYEPNLPTDATAAELNRPFKVEAWIRPASDRTNLTKHGTPNIAQMGVTSSGSMWKMSIYRNGYPLCQWRGTATMTDGTVISNLLVGVYRASTATLPKLGIGPWHVICERTAEGRYLTKMYRVYKYGQDAATPIYSAENIVTNAAGATLASLKIDVPVKANVWVGKKSGASVEADDAFAGDIDQLRIWSSR